MYLLLLLIQFIDCQQKSAFFRCRCITVMHEIFEVSDISSDECQLFTDRCSDLLSAALFCVCKCKIIFSCCPAVHAGSGKSICFAEAYNNRFQFLPCFIQQGKSCGYRILDGAQVASSIRVPLFSGNCSCFVSCPLPSPPEGGLL